MLYINTTSILNARGLVPVVLKKELTLKCNSIEPAQNVLLIDCCTDFLFNIKNKQVTINIIQPNDINFYNILNNLNADSDIKMLIQSYVPIYNKNDGIFTYSLRLPHLLFEAGKVNNHECSYNYEVIPDISLHKIVFKFNTFSTRHDELIRL